MRFKAICYSLILVLLSPIVGRTQTNPKRFLDGPNERVCITWEIESGQEINKRQAERLYLEAYKWVEEHVVLRKGTEPPCIVAYVGKACPDRSISGPCANPVMGWIYIPRWDSTSAGTIAQGTISTMLLHLLNPKEITEAARSLLAEDSSTYLDLIPGHHR